MATHIENLNIKSFRGLEDLKIENFGDVNIIVGDNNTGKTSVLEAIQLFCEPTERRFVLLAKERNPSTYFSGSDTRYLFNLEQHEENELLLSVNGVVLGENHETTIEGKILNKLISRGGMTKEIKIFEGKIKADSSLGKGITLGEDFEVYGEGEKKILDVRFIHVIDHLLSDAFSEITVEKNTKETAVSMLQKFDGSITDISFIKNNNKDINNQFIPVISTTKSERYVPLSIYGDGMKKALAILNAVISAKNGALLIDEFETSLHTKAMKQIFKFILDVAKELNVQLFLTTHSIEAIDRLLRCDVENVNRIKVIRIRKDENQMYAETIDGSEALRIRKKYGMELRL